MLIGFLLTVPNPMDLVIQEREQFQQKLAGAIEEIQEIQEEEARPDSSLSAEERANLEEALKKLKDTLSEAETASEALAALSEAEEMVNRLRGPIVGQDRELQAVGATLAASPATQALGQALLSVDESALLNAMEALAERINSMSEGELQELAAALHQAANAATGNEALAGSLRQASRTIGSNNPETALGQLADNLASLQLGVESLQTLEETQAGLRSARSVISGVAQVQATGAQSSGQQQGGGSSESGSGQGGQNGNGEAPGQGIGQGGPGERAAGVLAPEEVMAEAAQATGRGPDRETPPAGCSPMGRLFSYRAPAREFPRRCGRALARESPLEGYDRITKSWESTRSRPGSIWNEARCPRAIRTWCAATLRNWSSKLRPPGYLVRGTPPRRQYADNPGGTEGKRIPTKPEFPGKDEGYFHNPQVQGSRLRGKDVAFQI